MKSLSLIDFLKFVLEQVYSQITVNDKLDLDGQGGPILSRNDLKALLDILNQAWAEHIHHVKAVGWLAHGCILFAFFVEHGAAVRT